MAPKAREHWLKLPQPKIPRQRRQEFNYIGTHGPFDFAPFGKLRAGRAGAALIFSLFPFGLCYADLEFEEVGSLDTIQLDRLLPAQLTPSNPNQPYRSLWLTVRLADRFALAQRQFQGEKKDEKFVCWEYEF